MKREGVFFVLIFVLMSYVSASIDVNNYSLKGTYAPGDVISGTINLSVLDESFVSLITSSIGDEIPLSDFLSLNGAFYRCSPPDCANNYDYSGEESTKSSNIDSETVYVGFVLTGESVAITGLGFDIASDFGMDTRLPIAIDFFEGFNWKFEEFSEEFSSMKWGCYDPFSPTLGPLIRTSTYCEMIYLPDTNSVRAGAHVERSDTLDLRMVIYPEIGGALLGSCVFNPNAQDSCDISADYDDIFTEGYYQVCIEAPEPTNYRLYEEASGEVCGFAFSLGPESSKKDFSIFAQTAKYAAANSFSSEDIDLTSAVAAADMLIEDRYNRDCSEGCVLPMAISGIEQNVIISNIDLDYLRRAEDHLEDNVYDLSVVPALVSFNEVLDLEFLNFSVVEDGDYSVYLDGIKLFEENISIFPYPIIDSLVPINPPAGIPVSFHVSVDFEGSKQLKYKWDFGDGVTEETVKPSAVHKYNEINDYDLSVEVVYDSNYSTKKTFPITTISPAEAINVSLSQKNESLNKVLNKVNLFPLWYRTALKNTIKLPFYVSEMTRLAEERSEATSDEDFFKIASEVYNLNIPTDVMSDDFSSPGLLTTSDEIEPEVIADVGGSVSGELNDYRDPIYSWQSRNIEAAYSSSEFSITRWDGEIESVFTIYDFNVMSYGPLESYFVIDKPLSSLTFDGSTGVITSGSSTVISLDGESQKSFRFYYEGTEESSFFVSPVLSSLVIEDNIDTSCNYNGFCEKDTGEDYKVCRSDCKPTGKIIVYIILAILFVLVVYTILQIWYKRHYESYLFKDRRQLYNILMYVTNARVRGMKDGQIAADLRKQGWSRERIVYVIKKSHGKRTGMFEIIPIELVAAFFRERKARKNIATQPQQQTGGNINKSGY